MSYPVCAQQPAPETETAPAQAPSFGGPQSVACQLQRDREEREAVGETIAELQPYWDIKASIKKDHGFDFGMDYNAMIQAASQSPGQDTAASGSVRFFGRWTLLGRDSGNGGTLVITPDVQFLLDPALNVVDISS